MGSNTSDIVSQKDQREPESFLRAFLDDEEADLMCLRALPRRLGSALTSKERCCVTMRVVIVVVGGKEV